MLGSLRGAAVSLVATALAASSKKSHVAAGFLTINYPRSSSSSRSSRHGYSNTATTLMRMTSDSNNLFLFDFDGVVCDSCDECTVSAWRTCRMLNAIPNNDFDTTQDMPPQWLFEKMREIRPAIEVGWQIPVLLSVFLDQQLKSSPSSPAMSVQEVLENYEQLVEDWLKKYKLTDKDMIQTFGKVRDDWIAGKSSLS